MISNDISNKIKTIRQHPTFKHFSDQTLAELARLCKRLHFNKGEFIFHCGDPSDDMYMIESGRVIVSKDAPSGKSFTFVVAVQGITLNAVTCFKPRPRFFSARASEETTVLVASRQDFVEWVGRHADVAAEIIDTMGGLLDSAYNRIMDLIDESVEQRILNALSMLSSRLGTDLSMTNTELADMTGTSRETAARVISRLQGAGLLAKSRGQIKILDLSRLSDLSTGHVFLL